MNHFDREPSSDSQPVPLTKLQLWTILKVTDQLILFRIQEAQRRRNTPPESDIPGRRPLVSWVIGMLADEGFAEQLVGRLTDEELMDLLNLVGAAPPDGGQSPPGSDTPQEQVT